MPEDFLVLVIVIAVILVVLKLIKATVKLAVTAVIAAIVVYVIMQYTGGSFACYTEQLSFATRNAFSTCPKLL